MKNSLPKVAFVWVHNSCRSQIAEALGSDALTDFFLHDFIWQNLHKYIVINIISYKLLKMAGNYRICYNRMATMPCRKKG